MQFSLRTLMIVVTVASLLCFALLTIGGPLIAIVIGGLYLLSFSATISFIVYGAGNVRAFAIGCLPPLCLYWIVLGLGARLNTLFEVVGMLIILGLTLISGFVSTWSRTFCLRQADAARRPHPVPGPHPLDAEVVAPPIAAATKRAP